MSKPVKDEKNKGFVGKMLNIFEKNVKKNIPISSEKSTSGLSQKKRMTPVKKYKVLHCLKSYIYRITDDDLILVEGKPVKGYLQSPDELPRTGVQYRYVTLEEEKVHRFRSEKKIMGYGEIAELLLKPTDVELVNDVRSFLANAHLSEKARKEFVAGLKLIISEYCKGPEVGPEVGVPRVRSNDTQKFSSTLLTASNDDIKS